MCNDLSESHKAGGKTGLVLRSQLSARLGTGFDVRFEREALRIFELSNACERRGPTSGWSQGSERGSTSEVMDAMFMFPFLDKH